MPTDPYVSSRLDDQPSKDPNFTAASPPARRWQLGRPGDFNGPQPEGPLLGRPGPGIGYALTLAETLGDRLELSAHESSADARAVVAETAMKRAAAFGRAPVLADVELAATVLGYLGPDDADFAHWRTEATHGADHHYQERRRLVDAVPDDVLRMAPAAVNGGVIRDARGRIREDYRRAD